MENESAKYLEWKYYYIVKTGEENKAQATGLDA